MNSKLKIKGMGNMELIGDVPQKSKEYLISVIAERDAKRTDEKDPDSPIDIYEMTYLRTERIEEIGSKKVIKVQNGKTPSQKLRFVLRTLAALNGEDEEQYYSKMMSKIIDHYRDKLN